MKLFLTVALIFAATLTYAQGKNEAFSNFSVEHGLSSVTVTSILKDSRGYLWVGTEDGLNRYNGYEFKIYRNDPSNQNTLLTNRILTVFEDSGGTLWVSTGRGTVHYYDRQKDAFIREPQFNNLIVNAINEDDQRRVWFAGTTLKSLDLASGLWTSHTSGFHGRLAIVGIEHIEKNDYWIAADTALYKWNRKTGDLFTYAHQPGNPNSISYNFLYSIAKDKKGNLWIGTRGGGLDKFDVTTRSFVNYKIAKNPENGPLVNVVRAVCPDGDFVWVGTENGGLSKLDTRTGKFNHYTTEKDYAKSISDNSIKALYKDDEGRLWIGTYSFGLCVIDPYQNKFTSFKTSYHNTVVNAFFIDSRDRYWIGTEGGVIKIENGINSSYLDQPIASGQSGIPVLCIMEDSDRKIWIGTWAEGLFYYDERTDRFIRYATAGNGTHALSNQNVYALLEDSQTGNILIGTYLGLNILTSKQPRQFTWLVDSTWSVDNSNNCLKTIFEDRNGDVWVGSCAGIKLYDRRRHQMIPLFSDNSDYNDNIQSLVFCLFEDSRGRLWAGTESGLYHLKDKSTFERFTIDHGLTNHNIKGIQEDEQGNLWISTSNGMSVFSPETKAFKNYDDSDGLMVNGFKGNSSFRDEDGMLYFGGSNGVITFDPSQIVDNPHPPSVVLEDFKVFNKSVAVNSEDSILRKHISETTRLKLQHHVNVFSIEYAALNLSASDKNQYAYRLIGFDDKWNHVGATRSTTYTNLDPGEYTFEVKASNNDGVWSMTPASLVISISPPWWKTPWAYAGYLALAIVLLYVFRRITLMRAHFINDLRLERVKLENAERLNTAKLQFFTNISHEFRTPLTLILGPVQTLIENTSIDLAVRSRLQSVQHNAQRLHKLVNQLLDFRKAESGNMKIAAIESDIVEFVKEIKLSFDPLADQLNVDFSIQSDAEEMMVWFDQDQLEKVIFNLLSNSFKNIQPHGVVTIKLSHDAGSVRIVVFDNGKGIRKEHLSTIFEPFFSHEEGKNSTGTGIGLSLSRSLVELHRGTLTVESEEGQFARFTVSIPLGNTHFKPSEIVPLTSPRPLSGQKVGELIAPARAPQSPPAPGDDAMTILVVEDNAEVSDYIVSILNADYHVVVAFNGKQGFERALDIIPDLIISDVMMPVMDGITMCKQLKQHVSTCHIPVILLTARTSNIYKIDGLETGADDYITKPFNSKVLALKVRNFIETRHKLYEMLADSRILHIEPRNVAVTSRDETFVKAVLDNVEANMANAGYTVDDLCKGVGMSKATLFRKLKALTGQSANEFVRTIRLKRAAQILTQGDFSVAEVAYMVGFNDPKYFRNCFKKLFGMAPSEYADKAKAGVLPPERP